jgi:beta-glucuronidase
MIRLFDEHAVRPVRDLGGQWDFVAEPRAGAVDPAGLPTVFPQRLQVPGCWETHPDWRAYRGKAWLRRPLVQPEAGALRLVFKGASHTARVFLDRQEVGGHYNAYTAFEIALADVPAGEHELLVEVDNSFGPHSALHVENDYYTYGGITRPVAAESIPPQYLRRLHVTPRMGKGRAWSAEVRVEVANLAPADVEVSVEVATAGQTLDLGTATVKGGGAAWLAAVADFPDAQAWSPETPALDLFQALLYAGGGDEPVDDLADRVGFREVMVRGTEILLNGRPIRLRGFNRHEDHGLFGCALPPEAMAHDLDRLQHLGAGAVRTSHYPNDERFLDLCDERGMLVWEENHARGLKLEQMQHPLFRGQALACTREMVEQHFNHPSIVLWGILNECASFTPEGRALYAEQFDLIKRLDPSRPTTFASCHEGKDLCLDLPDVVGFNIYTGWYRDPVEAIPRRLEELLAWIERAGGRGKPVILSEFGAAALYGCRSDTRAKWTEERQADILDAALACYLAHPRLAGALIWQFCDCRVTEGWFGSRPRTYNNKGVLDEYRRAKLAYETVRRRFCGAAEASGPRAQPEAPSEPRA